jgi:predicted acetyltransferase
MEQAVIRVGNLSRAEQDAAQDIDAWAFPQNDPDFDVNLTFDSLDWDRFFGAWVQTRGGERLAGINTTYRFEITVPGDGVTPRSVPCAGLTWVGVHPQFRRRGVLTAMMRHQLRTVREEGEEPVAALFASEPVIYGRFGYGLAARHLSMRVPAGSALRPMAGSSGGDVRFEIVDDETHTPLVAAVYERARLQRPGSVSRPSAALNRYSLVDPPSWRVNAERLRIAIAFDPVTGEDTGYAIFRRSLSWAESGPDGKAEVRELAATDRVSEHALWTRMLSFDLIGTVRVHHQPFDGVLATSLERLPSTGTRVWDNIWVRVVDVPRALAARGYACDVDAVLEVGDALFPQNAGRWRLRGGPDGATCEPATEDADLRLDVRELGSAYLGGTTLTALAGAGLAEPLRAERLSRISAAFQSTVQPLAIWGF